MPHPPIPRALFLAIGTAPTIRVQEDQWGEEGYVLVDGVVHHYGIDRQCSWDQLLHSWPVGSLEEAPVPEAVRRFFAPPVGSDEG